MQDTPELLIAYCKEQFRICPMPQFWNVMSNLLPPRIIGNSTEKSPPPLILAAWHEAPAILKMLRLEEQIRWSFENGNFDKISDYLRRLKEDQWFHIGE
jgi:hypothetical protein